MKRKELHNYIRTEIINELSLEEETVAWNTTNKSKAKQQIDKSKLSSDAKKEAKDEIDQNSSGLISNVSEMARTPSGFIVGDEEKFNDALEIYEGSLIGTVLELVRDAGETGISQREVMSILNISNQPVINPVFRELADIGAIVSIGSPKTVKPEKAQSQEVEPEIEDRDEEDVEVKDDYEKVEKEETPIEVEPTTLDIKSTEKEFGGEYGKKLSPEDEEKYQKIRKGIEGKIKKLADMSASERAKSPDLQVLRALINKEDIKKLFKDKGVSLKDLVGDIIG